MKQEEKEKEFETFLIEGVSGWVERNLVCE